MDDPDSGRPPSFWRSDLGASLVEYALLLALIALVCIAAAIAFGGNVGTSFSNSGSAITSAA